MLRKLRAIIIDDEEMVRELYSRVLTIRGYEVLAFGKAFTCQRCQASPDEICADLILSDCMMPEITGVEFAQHLKDLRCRIQNIALFSGAWEQDQMDIARQLNCRIFTKPVCMADFYSWLDEVEKNIDLTKKLNHRLPSLS